jgi:hypothetical protein
MKKSVLIVSMAVFFTLFWITSVFSVDQIRSGQSMTVDGLTSPVMMAQGMGGGMDGRGMMRGQDMMGGMGMMHGQMGRGAHCPMAMGTGDGLMMQLHQWMRQFMNHRMLFDLSSEQMSQIDDIIMGHLKNGIKNKAEIQVQMVELRQMLARLPMDMGNVENQLKRIADLRTDFHLEGIRVSSQVLDLLDDQQQKKVEQVIGSPFTVAWEGMFSPRRDFDDMPMEMEEGM